MDTAATDLTDAPWERETTGARFYRADLHIHSFASSHDVRDTQATPQAIVQAAHDEGLDIIALTDHNDIRNVREAVAHGEQLGVLVIPGVELSTPEGHLLCYAPHPDALERFVNRIDIADRGKDSCRCQTGALQCLNEIAKEEGFGVLAHVELTGAFESNLPRSTPAKIDILCHKALVAIEITRADCPITYNPKDPDQERKQTAEERIKRLQLGSQQYLARVMNSDAHSLSALGRNAKNDRRVTRYKMEKPSFDGLRIALATADTRVRLEEDLPDYVPIISGARFEGGFLDGIVLGFSANLTCIIGGRGSGKSTIFESLRLLGGHSSDEVSVIDSDVWPDLLTLGYRDQTGHLHNLARNRNDSVENLDDSIHGSTIFPLESYRQGETNELSKRVQNDPLALLTFLDRLVEIEELIEAEDQLRGQLMEKAEEIKDAKQKVAKIPSCEKELALKSAQLKRLRDDKAEEVIQLQQQLESEKRARASIEKQLNDLSESISLEDANDIIDEINASVSDEGIKLASNEASQIATDTGAYKIDVTTSASTLRQRTKDYISQIRTQLKTWSQREQSAEAAIDKKRQELLNAGIHLDMQFIRKTVSDEAKAQESLQNLRTWEPHLKQLEKEYTALLNQRWSARQNVATKRTAFATRSSLALKSAVSDLSVTLKYGENSLSPDAERIIIETMGWRTTQHLRAKALVRDLTLRTLLDCVKKQKTKPITDLRSDEHTALFSSAEASSLLERLAEPSVLHQLESVTVHDLPRLSVTKQLKNQDGSTRFVPRDFSKLSLGQQQSVLLALMLTSESQAPLIVDQPEDNLDSEFIYKTLVPAIRAAKERRQVIVVTHNANIAVLGDAELIIALKATNEKASIVARGSIDEKATRDMACNILEGSKEAFKRRAVVYGIL